MLALPDQEPLVTAVYTFGPILDTPGADLDGVDIALVLNAPAEEVSWGAEPPWTGWIVTALRLGKAPVRWFWRPAVWPVWNHHIDQPLRSWSLDGPEEQALQALADGQAQQWRLSAPSAEQQLEQVAIELTTARWHLRWVQQRYWNRDWRHEHKGFGSYPETHLYNAVWAIWT